MRIILITSATTALVALAGYLVSHWADWTKTRGRDLGNDLPPSSKGSDAQRFQSTHVKAGLAMRQVARVENDVHQRFTELQERLQALEAEAEEGEQRSRDQQPSHDHQNGNSPEMTNRELGEWLSERLLVEPPNRVWASAVQDQIRSRLSDVPGLELDSVECSERFCRMVLTHESGTTPDFLPILSAPAFSAGAFTILAETEFSMFVPAQGTSIESLMSEAKQDRSRLDAPE